MYILTDAYQFTGYRQSLAKLLGIALHNIPSLPARLPNYKAGTATHTFVTGVVFNTSFMRSLKEHIAGENVLLLIANPDGKVSTPITEPFWQGLNKHSASVQYCVSEESKVSILATLPSYTTLAFDSSEIGAPVYLYDKSTLPVGTPIFIRYKDGNKTRTRLLVHRGDWLFEPLNANRNVHITPATFISWAPVMAPDNTYYEYS